MWPFGHNVVCTSGHPGTQDPMPQCLHAGADPALLQSVFPFIFFFWRQSHCAALAGSEYIKICHLCFSCAGIKMHVSVSTRFVFFKHRVSCSPGYLWTWNSCPSLAFLCIDYLSAGASTPLFFNVFFVFAPCLDKISLCTSGEPQICGNPPASDHRGWDHRCMPSRLVTNLTLTFGT